MHYCEPELEARMTTRGIGLGLLAEVGVSSFAGVTCSWRSYNLTNGSPSSSIFFLLVVKNKVKYQSMFVRGKTLQNLS